MIIDQKHIFTLSYFETPCGRMVAIADGKALYFLAFADQQMDLNDEIARLSLQMHRKLAVGHTSVMDSIADELDRYFAGTLTEFKTPCVFSGTPFQKQVWQELQKIPYGKTCSYTDLARAIGRPSAFRAVAQANRANQLAVIVPCHRVVYASGALGGYAGGLAHKQWLINHEARMV